MSDESINTQSNLLRAIQENHAALIAAQDKAIAASNRQAEECLKLRQAEEHRISEERLRREAYERLIERLDVFSRNIELTLEVLRMIASPLLKSQPPETEEEQRIAKRLLKKLDSNEVLKMDKLAELERALYLETDSAKKFGLKQQIEELKHL